MDNKNRPETKLLKQFETICLMRGQLYNTLVDMIIAPSDEKAAAAKKSCVALAKSSLDLLNTIISDQSTKTGRINHEPEKLPGT
ncbi:MAG: hypothetical protein HKM93_01130 [Desulfobacteraceae bacterium]|nr:hypothetical protein [Desulfobacteraceae bacterium]